jgi:aromatic ring-opening dioxygenase LigB subunit
LIGVLDLFVVLQSLDKPNLPKGAIELREAAQRAAQQIISLEPDILLLITPHGIGVRSHPTIYLNQSAGGNSHSKTINQ